MTSYDSVLAAISNILKEHCGIEREIKREFKLQEDLGLDSMGLLNLALEVENRFEIFLEEDAANPPITVHDVVELAQQRILEQTTAA